MKKGRHCDGYGGGSGGMRGATGGLLGGQKQARLEPRVSARPSSPACSRGRADSKRFAQGAGGLNTPSGGAPPAPHFAMCRSGHTEADKVEFKTEMSSDFF